MCRWAPLNNNQKLPTDVKHCLWIQCSRSSPKAIYAQKFGRAHNTCIMVQNPICNCPKWNFSFFSSWYNWNSYVLKSDFKFRPLKLGLYGLCNLYYVSDGRIHIGQLFPIFMGAREWGGWGIVQWRAPFQIIGWDFQRYDLFFIFIFSNY